MSFYINQIFEDTYPVEAVFFCTANNLQLVQITKPEESIRKFQIQQQEQEKLTQVEYEEIVESYLLNIRNERGYNVRQPDAYINSSNQRWKQDAIDYIQFRDKCLQYVFQICNNNIQLTQDELLQQLPKIKWTIE